MADLDLHDPATRERVQEAIGGLAGIVAARVVAGFDRAVDEIHVVTTADRHPKQTVRDVQSLLYATFGLSIDHRVVSVVQVDSHGELVVGSSRVVIQRVTSMTEGLDVRIRVEIGEQETTHTGEATGPASANGRRRATARAAIEALRPLLDGRLVVDVEGVAIEEILGHRLAITLVHLLDGRGERTVSGTAAIRDDEGTAITRSVLDALNRELTLTA